MECKRERAVAPAADELHRRRHFLLAIRILLALVRSRPMDLRPSSSSSSWRPSAPMTAMRIWRERAYSHLNAGRHAEHLRQRAAILSTRPYLHPIITFLLLSQAARLILRAV